MMKQMKVKIILNKKFYKKIIIKIIKNEVLRINYLNLKTKITARMYMNRCKV